jgi:hypothetical protein
MSAELDAIEAQRAERKAKLAKQAEAQRAVDLVKIDALEVEHGDSNIKVIEVPFTPGLVTLAAVRAPSPPEVKRYRSRVKPNAKTGEPGDAVAAAEELASVCRVYPGEDEYAALLEARPGLHVQLGVAAIQLAAGRAEDAGKG